jgi:hypothetical protein
MVLELRIVTSKWSYKDTKTLILKVAIPLPLELLLF